MFKKIKPYWFCLFFNLSVIFLGVLFNNRSLILGALGSTFFFAIILTKLNRVLVAFSVVLITVMLFFLKFDSSLGRILIYKISCQIFKDHWLFGVGFGNLKKVFPYYQEIYFREYHFTEKEFLLADNTFYVFNEFYTLILEFGILFIPIVIAVMCFIIKRLKSVILMKATQLNLFVGSLFLIISIYSCFNISFSAFPILYVFFILVFTYILTIPTKQGAIYLLCNSCCLFMLFVCFKIEQTAVMKNLNYFRSGASLEYQEYFKDYQPFFHTNRIHYLTLQREYYEKHKMWEATKDISIELMSEYPSNTNLMKLGLVLEKVNEVELAEKYLTSSVCVVPNRLITRYELFKFYIRMDKIDSAKKIGKELLNINIKIHSDITDFIIFDVKNQINRL